MAALPFCKQVMGLCSGYRVGACWKLRGDFRMRYKYLALGLFIIFVFTGSSWAEKLQFCGITSDTTPPAVDAGATHAFTASCPNPVWSVSGPGSINPSTGVYTAPATVWAQDVSRGWQDRKSTRLNSS